MDGNEWEEIDGFRNWDEYERFRAWIEMQLREHIASEMPVISRYFGQTLIIERWFVHLASSQTWRLVAPDPPSPGLFQRVPATEFALPEKVPFARHDDIFPNG